MAEQGGAPFKFLVRPIITANMSSKNLSWMLEHRIFSSFHDVVFSSSISGILVIPPIIDKTIASTPPDYLGYKKSDNSVSVGINIDFTLWERSSELERLHLLVDNVHSSLDKIQIRYLADEDRKKLHLIVDEAQVQLASQLLN
jgi:hypothetical protein